MRLSPRRAAVALHRSEVPNSWRSWEALHVVHRELCTEEERRHVIVPVSHGLDCVTAVRRSHHQGARRAAAFDNGGVDKDRRWSGAAPCGAYLKPVRRAESQATLGADSVVPASACYMFKTNPGSENARVS